MRYACREVRRIPGDLLAAPVGARLRRLREAQVHPEAREDGRGPDLQRPPAGTVAGSPGTLFVREDTPSNTLTTCRNAPNILHAGESTRF